MKWHTEANSFMLSRGLVCVMRNWLLLMNFLRLNCLYAPQSLLTIQELIKDFRNVQAAVNTHQKCVSAQNGRFM